MPKSRTCWPEKSAVHWKSLSHERAREKMAAASAKSTSASWCQPRRKSPRKPEDPNKVSRLSQPGAEPQKIRLRQPGHIRPKINPPYAPRISEISAREMSAL
jgi:hypothetical protein